MNYIMLLLLIGINIILVYMLPKKEDNVIKRTIKDTRYNLFLKEYKVLNIFFLIFNIAFIALDVIYEKSFIADAILSVCLLITFILFIKSVKPRKLEYHIIANNNIRQINMIRNVLLLLLITSKIVSIQELYQLGYLIIIALIFVLINLFRVFAFFKDNKDITKYKTIKSDYLTDIKGTLFLEKKSILTYLGIGAIIIFILYFRIKFAFIGYILVSLLVFIIYNIKTSNIKHEYKKLHSNMVDMNIKPGPLYIYQFKKDIIGTNNIIIYLILFIVAAIMSYVVGEVEYILIGIDIFLIALYTLFESKRKYIRYTYALNKDLINKDLYNVNINNIITDTIDYKLPFIDLKLYKLIYLDNENNIYVSEIELYNIKEVYENIDIMIRSTNIDDYIVVEEEYY